MASPAANEQEAANTDVAVAADAAAAAAAADAASTTPCTVTKAAAAGQDAQQPANGEPQKPKKALSAYWLFTNKVRETVTQEIRDKNGGKANFGEVAKTMSSRWAALSEEEKKEFEDKAAEDKKRYTHELKLYLEASDPAGTLRKKYEHLIPKRPLSAYMIFTQDDAKREKATAALKEAGVEPDNKKLVSKLAEMWKAASSEDKAAFEEKHKSAQEEFLRKQKEWQATPEFAEIERAANKQAERQKAGDGQETKDEGKGAKRSRSVAKGGKAKEDKEATAKDGAQQQSPQSAAKKPRKAATGKDKAAEPAIDAGVLAEATKLGLDGMLKNLAARPEVASSGKTAREMLQALQNAGGLVNPAKRALLGAAGA